MMRTATSTAIAALLLSGCAVVPTASPPVVPSTALGGFLGAQAAGARIDAPPEDWWRLFEDPALDAHVQRALAANADLRIAIANLEVARAQRRQAVAAGAPATVIESGAGPERADSQPSTSSVPKTSYELGATVAYEVDLSGRLRSTAAAADADAEAVAALLGAARVAVVADTVAAYLDLCWADANTRLAGRQIVAQQASYDVTNDQLRSGEVSPLELAQAALARDRVAATAPLFQADRRRALFRLAVLQGQTPTEAERFDAACAAIPRAGASLPVGDGAGLIARRPDIREAEHRLQAATARIGVATADLYPRVQLAGSAGLIGGGFDAILTPLATWAFPNQQAARARIAVARGGEASALANWDRVMLRALGEVETALSDLRAEGARQTLLLAASTEADAALRRAEARRRLGADNPLLVLNSERTRNEMQSQLIASRQRLAQLQVALFRALGGGWQAAPAAVASR